jgi:hypothetical protein
MIARESSATGTAAMGETHASADPQSAGPLGCEQPRSCPEGVAPHGRLPVCIPDIGSIAAFASLDTLHANSPLSSSAPWKTSKLIATPVSRRRTLRRVPGRPRIID